MKTIFHQKSIVTAVLFGLLVTLGLIIVSGGVVAFLITNGSVQEGHIGYGAMFGLFIATVGGCVCTIIRTQQKLFACLLHAISVFLLLLLYAFISAEGPTAGILPTAGLLMGAAMAVYLSMRKSTKKHRYLHRK